MVFPAGRVFFFVMVQYVLKLVLVVTSFKCHDELNYDALLGHLNSLGN